VARSDGIAQRGRIPRIPVPGGRSRTLPRTLVIVATALALAVGFALGRATAPASDTAPVGVEVFRQALEETDWLERSAGMSRFLQHLGPENLPEALAALEPQLPWIPTDELRLFMLAWSRFDAAGALAHALALPRPFHRNASGAAIYAWAYRDPEAALEALDTVEEDDLRKFMAGRMVAGWAHGGHERSVTEYLSSLPKGPERFAYVGMLAWELSKRGPEALTAWAEGAPAAFPSFKNAVFLKASTTLSSIDPAQTARWLTPYLDRPYAAGTLRVVARSWANRDPEAALDWLTTLPPAQEVDAAVSNAFRVWLSHSPEPARVWLRARTPSPALDPALAVMAARARDRSPGLALPWALTMSDEELRAKFVIRLGRRWLHNHPEAARAWLERNPLPPDLHAAILDPTLPVPGEAEDDPDWLESDAGDAASDGA